MAAPSFLPLPHLSFTPTPPSPLTESSPQALLVVSELFYYFCCSSPLFCCHHLRLLRWLFDSLTLLLLPEKIMWPGHHTPHFIGFNCVRRWVAGGPASPFRFRRQSSIDYIVIGSMSGQVDRLLCRRVNTSCTSYLQLLRIHDIIISIIITNNNSGSAAAAATEP